MSDSLFLRLVLVASVWGALLVVWRYGRAVRRSPEVAHFGGWTRREKALLLVEQDSRLAIARLGSILVIVIGPLAVAITAAWLGWRGKHLWVAGTVAPVVLVGMGAIAYTVVSHRRARAKLRKIAVDSGIPVCLNCGYDLRLLPPLRCCPECGELFDERRCQHVSEDRAVTADSE